MHRNQFGEVVGMSMDMLHSPSGLLAGNATLTRGQSEGSLISILLGFVFGMQWNNNGPSLCYETIELNIITIDELLSLLTQIYLP